VGALPYSQTVIGQRLTAMWFILLMRNFMAPRDFSQAAIKLLPDAITTINGNTACYAGEQCLAGLMTRENPPRVLNRERCDAANKFQLVLLRSNVRTRTAVNLGLYRTDLKP
jgi:hypothetical protein